MDAIQNPYAPGAGTPPPLLTGRDAEIERFRILLERVRLGRPEKSLMITGLRGVGKTVLLNHFRDLAVTAGYKTAETEITHETNFKETMARLSRRIVISLKPMQRVKDKALQAARVLRAFTLKLPDGYEIGFNIDAATGRADSGNLSEDLTDLFVALGAAAKDRKSGVIFLLDEIQFLKKVELEALIAALHSSVQQGLPVIPVGAGLPQWPKLAGEAKSYAERLFDFPKIDKLATAAARRAIESPEQEKGVRFKEEAISAILTYTGGYPYFLQEYGKIVWNLAPKSPITGADVFEAQSLVQTQLDDNFFRVRMARTTAAERKYVSAMASLGSGPYKSGEVAAKLGKDSPQVGPIRSKLISKGLIYSPSHGITDFTVPQFDKYLRRLHPFRQRVK